MESELAVTHLRGACPRMAALVEEVGPCLLHSHARTDSVFEYLTRAIVFQQLSGKAAGTIHARLMGLFPDKEHPSPEDFLRTPPERMREAGVSASKANSLIGLARQVAEGLPDVAALADLPDDEVVGVLGSVKGIGVWTAQMFLLFRLQRPDVWPVDDTGVKNGLRKLYELEKVPNRGHAEELGEPFRPVRSYAAWYLWRSLDLRAP